MELVDIGTPEFRVGTVWLVGAGPGDAGLLTLHGLKALQQADIVVHDALVSGEVLALANDAALLECVGKRGGKPSLKQDEINQRLAGHALAGKKVVRLKGGDPFVFGRGAEEALALADRGIAFHVVPGITTGIGGLAAAGIPVTHGPVNQSVTFLSGHDPAGEVPGDFDWNALAKSSQVLVLYMAIRHMPAIAGKLLRAGRLEDEPVAFVRNATLPDQQVLKTTLGMVAKTVQEKLVKSPSVVVIGAVVNLREVLDNSAQQKDREPGR